MTIDIRATCACSLGTLISGSINDEYVQGTGLIKCSGSVELAGVYTPAIGTAVTFTYTRGGVTTTVPRKLRVLSSFADPFRRTTRVELGCKLTYLADKKPAVNWDAFDDPENADLTEEDAEIITIPIRASSVMQECLNELGIGASSNPLTNRFSIAEFDFSGGYVQVLSDLLVSESYVGYLDQTETLQVVSLDQSGGTGPVVDKARIIDLGPIGAGQLPGESVTVSFSSLKLRMPELDENAEKVASTDTTRTSNRSYLVLAWNDEQTQTPQSRGYAILATTTTTTFYREMEVEERNEATGAVRKSKINVVGRRTTAYTISSVAILGGFFSQCLAKRNTGGLYINFPESTYTTESYVYDKRGEEIFRETVTNGSMAHASGQVGVPLVFDDGTRANVQGPGRYLMDRQTVKTIRNGDKVKTITQNFGPWIKTIAGQQAIAEAREAFTTASQVQGYISEGISGNYLLSTEVNEQRTTYKGQQAPRGAERTNAANADDSGDPGNGYRTDGQADLELAVGSATAQRRIELSLPYAPDDVFTKTGDTYTAQKSDAEQKARKYGRVQNQLLLGNRSGMSLQTGPGILPTAPFAPFVVQANGLSALYRTNGLGWTFGPDGVVVSTDALFWGSVGGTGDFWFPVAPGITSLPTTPPVVNTAPTVVLGQIATVGTTPQTTLNTAFPGADAGDGVVSQDTGDYWKYDGETWENVGPTPGPTMTSPAVVPVWNETVALQGRLRLRTRVEGLPYALTLPDVEVEGRVRLRWSVARLVTVDLPLSTLSLSAPEPLVYSPAVVNLPVSTLSISAPVPTVEQGGVIVELPVSTLSLSTSDAEVVGSLVQVDLPLTTLALTAPVPSVAQIEPMDGILQGGIFLFPADPLYLFEPD